MADKAWFQVTTGLIPGQEDEREYRKTWVYTSEDLEKDAKLLTRIQIEGDEEQQTIFETMMAQASQYAQSLIDPSRVNWVQLNWIWL
jgi:hypothetical protein